MISANRAAMTPAGAERRRYREKFLLAWCRIRGESFVAEVRGGRNRPSGQGSHEMTRYLISFDGMAMDHIPEEEQPAVGAASHAVVQEAVNAGVWVFGGGLESRRASVVATDGTVTDGPYPETKEVVGGFSLVDVPSREEALAWAAKIAVACRCAQTVWQLMDDAEQDAMLRQADRRW
jgi:hypothetical protein